MSKLIEKHLARLASKLEPKPLQQNITKILEQHVQRHDPQSVKLRAQYSAHFDDLFSGLSTIQTSKVVPETVQVKRLESGSPEVSLDLFKSAYYHGKLTQKLAAAALRNPTLKVYEIASMFRLVEEGGTLIKWSHGERLFFELQVASRLWGLKYQSLAKQIICDSFEEHQEWIYQSIDTMPAQRVRVLVQALRAASPDLCERLLDSSNAIRPLWIMWSEFRRELREKSLNRLESVLHTEIITTMKDNPLHPVLLKASPATDTQVMDLLLKSDLIEPYDPPKGFLTLSER